MAHPPEESANAHDAHPEERASSASRATTNRHRRPHPCQEQPRLSTQPLPSDIEQRSSEATRELRRVLCRILVADMHAYRTVRSGSCHPAPPVVATKLQEDEQS